MQVSKSLNKINIFIEKRGVNEMQPDKLKMHIGEGNLKILLWNTWKHVDEISS